MKRRYSLLVFDWDGTLVDSERKIVASAQAAIEALNLPQPGADSIRNIIGLGLREAIEVLFPSRDEEFHGRFVEYYRHHFLENGEHSTAFFPGAIETLYSLKAEGYILAVATGKSRRGLARELSSSGLTDVFDGTRCADEAFSKPHPRMLQDIMDDLSVDAHETVMIGDTEYDLEMAKSAGTHGIGVSYGVHGRERLLRFDPIVCLDTITELPEYLRINQKHSGA